MTRTRLITALLTLALALASAPAVLADSHEGEPFDPAAVEEWNEDEALVFYNLLQERLLAMGVAAEDMDEAMVYVQETYGELDEEDIADLMEAAFISGAMDELSTEEEGEAVDLGDDEVLQSDEEEPDVDIEIGDDEEEEESE